MFKRFIVISAAAFLSLVMVIVAGCESQAGTGAGIGGLAGAGLGAIIGAQSGHTAEGALIGGAVGAGGGYIIGNEQDKKRSRAEIDQLREEGQLVTVNITNSNGSVSQVILRKQGIGFVGPKGEYYNTMPTEAQLKPVYGF